MRRSRITITLNTQLLNQIDLLIDGEQIRNRSHAIEYLLAQFFQTKIKKAVILAGGRTFHGATPSPLLLIKGKPVLEYLIRNLKQNGIADIIICTDANVGKQIRKYFGKGQAFGITIVYSEENELLHTGGALLKIKANLHNEPFLLVYGDILTDLPLRDFIAFHEKEGSLATVALAAVEETKHYGQLTLHGTRLVHFYQKTKAEIKSHLVNSGIYAFEPSIFDFFPKGKHTFFLEDIIKELIEQKKVSGFVFNEQWFEVGNAKNYKKALLEFNT